MDDKRCGLERQPSSDTVGEQRKGKVDKLAAAILLQSYLDSLGAGAG